MTVYRRPDPIPMRREARQISSGDARQPLLHPEAGRTLHAVRAEPDDLHHLVARQIFAAILAGDFPEGSILPNEHRLSEDLGVSRTALREAVKGLASKGLLETRRRRGTMVLEKARWNMLDAELMSWSRRIGPAALVSDRLWQALAATLPALASLAAGRRGASAALRQAASALDDRNAGDRPATLASFLSEVARAGRNPYLASLVSTCLGNLLAEDPAFLGGMAEQAAPGMAGALVAAIGAGDAGDAERAMRALLTPQRVAAEA